MKNLIGITCYPINDTQIKMLNECIDSLKPLGYDIMVLSHYPIDLDIQRKVNFVHYDADNPLLPPYINQHNFLKTDTFESKIFNSGHALAISKNMSSLFSFAQNMDYDYCICVEFDCTFHLDDVFKIQDLIEDLKSKDKKTVVFNPSRHIVASCHYEENGPYYCETCFFISEPKFFIDKFSPPRNMKEWLNNNMCYTLEITLYDKLKLYKSDVEFIDLYTSEYFNKSNMNQHRYGLFNCEVVYNETDPGSPVLLVNNLSSSDLSKNVKVYLNDGLISDTISFPGTWFYLPLSLDGSSLKYEVISDGYTELSKELTLSPDLVESLREKLSCIRFK